MATINTTVKLIDAFSTPFAKLNDWADKTNTNLQSLSQQAKEAFDDEPITNFGNGLDGLASKAMSVVSVMALIGGAKKAMDISDTFSQTTARINNITSSAEESLAVQEAIFQSAQRSRASYTDTADAVAKLATNTGKVFSGNQEIIDFLETVNKAFVLGGSSAESASGAMTQLTQGLASGALRGDELNSVLEGAPIIARKIEENMGWATGSIKEYAEQGLVTAEVVKNAMLSSSEEITEQFESMPMTFAQVWTSIENQALKTFSPVLKRMSEFANSADFNTMVTGIINALSNLANVALGAFEILANVASFVVDNWSLIVPVISLIVGLMTLYTTAMIVHNAIQGISTTLKTIGVIWSVAHGKALTDEMIATTSLTKAQLLLNSAMLANPIIRIITLIMVLVGVFYLVIGVINKVKGTAISATGVLVGSFMWALSVIGNIFIGTFNELLQIFYSIFVSPFISIFEWLLNAVGGGFDSFGGAVANLLGQVISWFLDLGKVVTKIVDAIFGTDWTSGLNDLQDSVLKWGKNEETSITISREAPSLENMVGINRFDNTDAYDFGYKLGENIDESIGNAFNPDDTFADLLGQAEAQTNALNNLNDTTGSIEDTLTISEEDLKYMRDLAEQEAVNRFTVAELKIDMTNNNNVSSGVDLDGVLDEFVGKVIEAVDTLPTGVYA